MCLSFSERNKYNIMLHRGAITDYSNKFLKSYKLRIIFFLLLVRAYCETLFQANKTVLI